MTQAKHTQGPWRLSPFSSNEIISGKIATTENMGKPIAVVNGWNNASLPEKEEYRANAHLIAAAPELLEALEHAAFHLERLGYEEEEPGMTKIRAAIAKARGGAG